MPDVNNGSGLEIADPEDFFVSRDEDGVIQPVTQQIPGREQALRIIPPTTGAMERFYPIDYDDPDADKVAEMFNRYLYDLETEVTPEMLEGDRDEGLIAFGVTPLLKCIEKAAGLDMHEAAGLDSIRDLIGDDPENLLSLAKAAQDEEFEAITNG